MNTRKYKGVYLIKKYYKDKVYTYYAAQIKVYEGKKQKTVWLGHHSTPERAAKMYNEACDEYRIYNTKRNIIGTYEEIRNEIEKLEKKNNGHYWSDRDLIRYKQLKEIDNEN